MRFTYVVGQGIAFLLTLMLLSCGGGQQADPEYQARTNRAAYLNDHPGVLFDEAHNNIHTVRGSYKPFADLLASDGYAVVSGEGEFSKALLEDYTILVISNPKGSRTEV